MHGGGNSLFILLGLLSNKRKKAGGFAHKGILNFNIDYLKQTIRCLCLGFLSEEKVAKNFKRNNPIYFIDKLMK